MSIIKAVLEEEYKRLQSLLGKYQREAAKLPKGAISIKKIAGQQYAYIAHRSGKKVIFDYIGKASSIKVKNLQEGVNKRKKYMIKIKSLKRDIKEMERALGGRKI